MALFKRRRRVAVAIAALLVLGCAAAVLYLPAARWRAEIIVLRATGQIEDIEWGDLMALLGPGSHQSLEPLVHVRSPYVVVRNPLTTPNDVAQGSASFLARCASCHGADARGGLAAPALKGRELSRGSSDWALYRAIRHGIAGTSMPPHALAREDVWRLVAHVRSVNNESSRDAATGLADETDRFTPISSAELQGLPHPGADWPMYSGSYDGMRHSSLTGITPQNVGRLAPAWIHQIGEPGRLESSPIVRDGVMFVTAPGRVRALDAATGRQLWQFARRPPADSISFPGLVNRGVALLDDAVYVGTADAHLIALSARTGKVLWDVAVVDYKRDRHYITGAPLAVGDSIVVGTGLKRSRGFIASYDAKTGAQRWRVETIPRPGEPGNDTWAGDSWEAGGGPAWLTGSYDPRTDTLYWGVGNPAPDYNAAIRAGDNLYTNSVLALQGASGKRLWHFQFTPNDDHDWDATQTPVIADFQSPAGPEKRLLFANRNGFYYVLDRESGRYLAGEPFVQQSWAERLDERGRPVLAPKPPNSAKGFLAYPSNVGGTSWWSPTMDPSLRMFYVPAIERGQIFFPANAESAKAENVPVSTGSTHYTAVRALDALTGKLVWEYRNKPRLDDEEIGGLMSTRSGLVFGGDQQRLFALDARNGRELWSFNAGGHIAAAPVTYSAGGRQYVSIAAGASIVAFATPEQGTVDTTVARERP